MVEFLCAIYVRFGINQTLTKKYIIVIIKIIFLKFEEEKKLKLFAFFSD